SQLSYTYPGQSEMIFPDIECNENEHALILGQSGVGKTTLLHLLGGILKPMKGEIMIGGTSMHALSGKHLDKFRGKHIGLIFQKAHFIRSLTALENLLLTQDLSGNVVDKKQAVHLMQRLGLEHKTKSQTHLLSVGEQQRLAIARALINKPDVILADEPSSALDDENCVKMINLLLEVANENNANLIIVTHDNRIKDLIEKKIFLNTN
ncbi:MAG TPA: ATP-binding cassette domain-containing protein, partial [Saprospiraceae bacterium]|nr:ATP-binding cassette domain-containing protein [Saprospiraceae bacterium]